MDAKCCWTDLWGNATIKKFPLRLCLILLFMMTLSFPMGTHAASFSKKAPVLSASQDGTSVTLTWKKRSGLTGYQIFRKTKGESGYKKIKSTRKAQYTVKNLTPGKVYYFRLRGYQKTDGKVYYTRSSYVRVKIPEVTPTLKKLLEVALQPVGSTMYVWGGGWNEEDTGAGKEARTIGVSPEWKAFFEQQTSSYDYNTTRYQISKGLDCSGYIGWCIYNILNTESGNSGYVMLAQNMASNFASRGWGTYTSSWNVADYRAGDIMSSSGHVYLVVGQCSDGSVVLLHSSPPGVQLAGTPDKNGNTDSKAVQLAARYMKKYFPEWYQKYPNCAKDSNYLTSYSQMRWDVSGKQLMTDPDNYRSKSASAILKDLFKTAK